MLLSALPQRSLAPVTFASYRPGNPSRPPFSHDNGFLDRFRRRAPTADERRQYNLWRLRLEAGEAIQGMPFLGDELRWPDALPAYRHFMNGSGRTREINYERYVNNDPMGEVTMKGLIVEAMNGGYDVHRKVLGSKSGCVYFTGTVLQCGGRNANYPGPGTVNWQRTIGEHKVWISGTIDGRAAAGPQLDYDLTFTVHMEDMYNFNPGAADISTGIPDDENGIFEITGLARQYLTVATLKRRIQWTGTAAKGFNTSMTPVLRQRQPGDSVRVRNRL
jgi:hypothetical protein